MGNLSVSKFQGQRSLLGPTILILILTNHLRDNLLLQSTVATSNARRK